MMLNLPNPILYLITRGATTDATTPDSQEFRAVLDQVSAAVAAGVQLIQIREKQLTAQVLFELAVRAVAIARRSSTRILINDRADIAFGSGADGVHLTTRSLAPDVVRKAFGAKILIGVSTHSLIEALEVRRDGADFVVFGPIFPSPSKLKYGLPLGPESLLDVVRESVSFPVIALGGISLDNVQECLSAGASGIAGISLFGEPASLAGTVQAIKEIARRRTGS
jgi:thiamine-phosphate pyrophosphorylase